MITMLLNGFALSLLTHRLLTPWAGKTLVGLRVRGRRSGRLFSFPVQYAADDEGLVVMPGHAEAKTWWRNLLLPCGVGVLIDGEWTDGVAWVLRPGEEGYDDARARYESRWPQVSMPAGQVLVRIVFIGQSGSIKAARVIGGKA